MHRHCLPSPTSVDESQRVEQFERGRVGLRAGDCGALPQGLAARDRRVAVDIYCLAAGLEPVKLQTTRTDFLERFPPRLPPAVVERSDDLLVEQRLKFLHV